MGSKPNNHFTMLIAVICLMAFCISMSWFTYVNLPSSLGGPRKSLHRIAGWNARKYFNDPNVIAMCEAIEANDITTLEHLVAQGADVNAEGLDGATPLLWAFPDQKQAVFFKMLDLGADPDVPIANNLGLPDFLVPGDTVTTICARSGNVGYLQKCLEHGGDPNSKYPLLEQPLVHLVISRPHIDQKDRLLKLIEFGADINAMDAHGVTPLIQSINIFQQFDLALILLEHGADPKIFAENMPYKATHYLAFSKQKDAHWSAQQHRDFRLLVERLSDLGESYDLAMKQCQYWTDLGNNLGPIKCRDAQVLAMQEAKKKGLKELNIPPSQSPAGGVGATSTAGD